jgi:hypothetical protein
MCFWCRTREIGLFAEFETFYTWQKSFFWKGSLPRDLFDKKVLAFLSGYMIDA